MKKRSAKKDLPFNLEDIRVLVRSAIDVGQCPYFGCFGEKITAKNFSVNHDLPTSRGGEDRLDNLVICTRSANLAKGMLTNTEFRELIKVLLRNG